MTDISEIPLHKKNTLVVSEPEAGQKLLRYLEKHTKQPSTLLHKWIRTGQVRINGKRSKPFQAIQKNDEIRLPPFVQSFMAHLPHDSFSIPSLLTKTALFGKDLQIIYYDDHIMALNKPSGLAVQPGSGLHDCVSDRLSKAFSLYPYTPAPAHRLDRYTSGVLLCGLTHSAQKQIHEWFANSHRVCKEYLVWVSGHWPYKEEIKLEDKLLKKKDHTDKEVMHVIEEGGQVAISYVSCLEKKKVFLEKSLQKTSLLKVKIVTGRTHQIRVQLSSKGYPVIGDPKYAGICYSPMLLHAWRVTLPEGKTIEALPQWKTPFSFKG